MKDFWEKLRKNKYFKVVLVLLIILLVGWLIYSLFIEKRLIFQENEKQFLEGVKNYYDSNSLELPKEGGYREKRLSEMGSWVDQLYVPKKKQACDGDSFVRVINEDGKYRYVTYLKCGKYESNTDHESPSIVLNGEDSVVVHLNATYEDEGVKEVKDNHGKIDPSKVKIDTSSVDTSKVGTYEVNFRVYDKNYNTATAKRTVVVAETLSARIQRENGIAYTYTGAEAENYVLFSGMMWRILKLDEDGNIAIITDNNIANLYYSNYGEDYKDSNVYHWLNDYFYGNINENSKQYILDATWCYDNQENAGIISTCNSSVKAKVGLLSVSDYEKSKEENRSYLVDNARFILLNKQSDEEVWISDIYNDNALGNYNVQDLSGVRPVIYLSKDIYVTAGEGSQDNPYKLQDYTYAKENAPLNSRLVGEYVVYSGYNFRIAGSDSDGNVKLVGVDLLENVAEYQLLVAGYSSNLEKITPNTQEEGNLYNELEEKAINYISDKSIVSHEYEIPVYESGKQYDQLEKQKITLKVGLPASYEMFSGLNMSADNYQIYWLSDYNESGIVTIVNGNNGLAFHLSVGTFPDNAIKPVIYVKKDLKIASGKGTILDPYYVR